MKNGRTRGASRRDFLKTGAAVGGVALANVAVPTVFAQGNDEIKVGLIGCGGRGTGAAEQCMRAGQNVKLYAMGDAFRDRLESCRRSLNNNNNVRGQMNVADDRCFVGLDAYRQVIANCDLVILATPPGFRPQHIEAAVNARKHVFTEKPVAVDGPGIRTVLAAYEAANRNNLRIVAGTQRRYQTGYKDSMQRIHDGRIGDITSARCYWNQGRLWNVARAQGMRDLEWQMRNWLYFTWLSGDHICEQHVHNLDVINWAMRTHPTKASGMGGRQVRTGPEFGHIFDHFAVELEYPNGVSVLSMCRQIDGCENNVSEAITGTRGRWYSPGPSSPGQYRIVGENAWNQASRGESDPYLNEHIALIDAIRNNRAKNDLRDVAESTLTAIMGRMACYTGRAVTWQQALESQERLMPANLAWDMTLAVPPVPRARS